ncbi:MAG: hypothetical protein AAGF99_16155 [Bacteroidota bacterium]
MHAQDGASASQEGPWQLRIYAGTASLGLGDIETRFNDALDLIRSRGLTMPVQRDFSPQIVVGGEAVFRFLAPRGARPGLALGVGVERAYTEAFSGYEDFSGTLDLEQETTGTVLEGVVQAQWHVHGPISAAVTARVGRLQTSTVLSETLDVSELEGAIVSEGRVEGAALALGDGVSLRYVWRYLGLSAELGYRYAEATKADLELSVQDPIFNDTTTLEDIETSEVFSGLRLTLGAFFTL